MLPSGGPGSASPAFTAHSLQPTVKERHLSHGLSAQHETTYFAGTGAIQAIEQPAPVLSVCAGRGDPRLALSELHHLAWSRRPSCIELRRSRTASRMRRFCSALDYCARMELYPGVFVSSLSAEVWEPDPEVGGEMHVLCGGHGADSGLSRFADAPEPIRWTLPGRETILVLEGAARIEIEGGPVLELAVGDLASLPAGARTTWHLTTPFKEFWVIA